MIPALMCITGAAVAMPGRPMPNHETVALHQTPAYFLQGAGSARNGSRAGMFRPIRGWTCHPGQHVEKRGPYAACTNRTVQVQIRKLHELHHIPLKWGRCIHCLKKNSHVHTVGAAGEACKCIIFDAAKTVHPK